VAESLVTSGNGSSASPGWRTGSAGSARDAVGDVRQQVRAAFPRVDVVERVDAADGHDVKDEDDHESVRELHVRFHLVVVVVVAARGPRGGRADNFAAAGFRGQFAEQWYFHVLVYRGWS
jgi:hypothetical protein